MTVTYTGEVATSKGFGCFLKLLFRWRGSIYKLVWPDLLLFLTTYFTLSILYRFVLDKEQQIIFEKISKYCEDFGNLIPVSFVLGFYVSIVVGRWWDQYKSIPWTDGIAVFISSYIHGEDEKGRVMRRTIMRYCCLSLTMCFTLISPRVKKRFPTLDHLVESGLLNENEKLIIEELNRNVPRYTKSWLPVVWASSIVTRARREGKIRDDFAVKTILDELNTFRSKCGLLISYDWISVPLVYTQVVTLAVYTYFFATIMGSQWVQPKNGSARFQIDLVFPVFTTLQFFFYMGWLKVAESLVNPFGDDDDDFLNWMIDRNLQVAYLIVDEMHQNHPELLRDQYWDEIFPSELPYTVASEQYRNLQPEHSTDKMHVSEADGEIVASPSVKLDDMSEHASVHGRRFSSRISLSKRGSIIPRQRTSSVRSTASQSTLAESISGRMSRATSITSVLKRMFSRERENSTMGSSTAVHDGRQYDGLVMGSTSNVHRNVMEDVIPELDENLTTIISMRGIPSRPTAEQIFAESRQNNINNPTTSSVGKSDTPPPDTLSIKIPPNPKKFYISMSVPDSTPSPINDEDKSMLNPSPSTAPASPMPPSTSTSTGTDTNIGIPFVDDESHGDDVMTELLPLKSSAFSASRERLSNRLAKIGLSSTTNKKNNEDTSKLETHLLADMSKNQDSDDDEDDDDDEIIDKKSQP